MDGDGRTIVTILGMLTFLFGVVLGIWMDVSTKPQAPKAEYNSCVDTFQYCEQNYPNNAYCVDQINMQCLRQHSNPKEVHSGSCECKK